MRPFLRFLSGLLKLFPDGRLPLPFAQHGGDILHASLHKAGIIPLAVDLPRLLIRFELHIRPYGLTGGVQRVRVSAYAILDTAQGRL